MSLQTKEPDVKRICELLEQWTRAEIMARHAYLDNSGSDYAHIKIEKENEIRTLIFGTDDLIQLGLKWQILKPADKPSKEDLKQQYQQLQKELSELMNEQ